MEASRRPAAYRPHRILTGLICLLALSAPPAGAEESPAWTTNQLPARESAAWARLQACPWWWEVLAGPGGLKLRAVQLPAGTSLGVPGGRLQGSMEGLDFQPAEAGQAAERLCGEAITAFYRHQGKIYALSANRNGEPSGGRLWLVEAKDGHYRANWVVELREPGWALAAASNQELWVVSQSRLFRIDLAAKRITVVMDKAFWNGLRPLSLAVLNGNLHIGMRGGIASLDPERRIVSWTERLEP